MSEATNRTSQAVFRPQLQAQWAMTPEQVAERDKAIQDLQTLKDNQARAKSEQALARMEADLPLLKQLWLHDAKSMRLKMVAYLNEGFTWEEAFALATRKL